ncbi:MAG: trigger factor [Betaproteobacteria bacterium RIFCSPLOWO2_02_FULL_65_24]|nr:MAG: trigger factor [Betaproteobacteria bacterium RIFCSPLOWO2_02_FULL_65_24]OGA77423.1 MAG: trigger factor [Betaproteobacteria bacterium RIFCSPLOWO2_12_FULL_66_14]
MQTNLETLSALERRLTMAVPAQDIDREVEERLKKLSRTVRMHGFRPGKVPYKLIAQQYGRQVRSEVIGDAVQKAFDQAVQENNLRVAGNPRIEQGEPGNETELAFSATFEIYPELKLGDISGATIEKLSLAVGENELDHTIEILRKQRVTWDPVERAAQSGDRVTIDFTGRIDGEEFPGGKASDAPLVLGEGRMLPEFETHLTGLKPGDTRTFEVKFPDDYAGREVAGKTASFEVAVKKVEQPKLPGVDAEFAKSLGVEDGDTGKMRNEVRANVEREVRKRIDTDLKQKVMQALIDTTPVEVPKSLVEMEIGRLVQAAKADLEARGIKLEQLPVNPEAFEAQAKRRVSLGLIIGELVKSQGLNAKSDQISALVQDYAQSYEHPGEMVRWVYSEPQRLAEFEGLAVETNIVKWVLEHAKIEEKTVTFDELMHRAAA